MRINCDACVHVARSMTHGQSSNSYVYDHEKGLQLRAFAFAHAYDGSDVYTYACVEYQFQFDVNLNPPTHTNISTRDPTPQERDVNSPVLPATHCIVQP
jgi:hypothetical protein